MTTVSTWQFIKSALLVILAAFVIGCSWGACRVGVVLVERLVP